MDTTSRTLEYLPLDKVAPTVRNPKEHDLPAIVTSIARFGMTAPMVRDERTGELVIGNGRRHALTVLRKHLTGEETPEVPAEAWSEIDRYLDGSPPGGVQVTDGEWLVPVVTGWASRDDEHATAMVVTDNRLTEKGGWDRRSLAELLDEIADSDPDLLAITGYTADDLDDLLAEFREESIILPPGDSDARWAETDEQFQERSELTASYADRHSSGAMIELILVFPVVEHGEAVELIRRVRDREGDDTAAQIVLRALRAYLDSDVPDAEPADAHGDG